MRQLNKFAADAILGFILLLGAKSAIASPIIPANDNTQTSVILDGDRIEINGGTLSGDGLNLFHSFEQFNLNSNQIADFLATPQLQNILGRVVGGNPSVIDGLIQVSNGSANLYLMNPAGIIFGSNATLNVPGDFFATTATGIGFGDNNWFEAFGQNDYLNLTGNPTFLAFDNAQPGAIVNAGDLSVSPGQNVALLGSNVVNTGNINAPDGNILVQSVPGTNLVRISQPDSILSVEVLPPRDSNNQATAFSALDLPALLTGSPVETGLVVDGDSVETTASTPVTGTTTVTGNLTAAHIDILGDRVSLIDTTRIEGEIVRIGGDYQGEGTIPNAQDTFVGTNTEINSNYAILWADDTTRFYGNISAPDGFVEVSGKENLIFRGNVDVGNNGQLLLDPENIIIVDAANAADDIQLNDSEILAQDGTGTFTISRGRLESLTGSIILEATNNIIIEDLAGNLLDLQAGDGDTVTFTADSDNDGNGDFIMEDSNDTLQTDGGGLVINANNITAGNLIIENTGDRVNLVDVVAGNVIGSNIELNAQNNIATGNIQTLPFYYDSNPFSTAMTDNRTLGGEVRITSQNGSVQTGNIITYTDLFANMGGSVTISTLNNIVTGDLQVSSGDVTLIAQSGSVEIGFIRATSPLELGSNIAIDANQIFRSNNSFSIPYFTQNPVTGFYDVNNNREISIITNRQNGSINIKQGGSELIVDTDITTLNNNQSGTQGILLIIEGSNANLSEAILDRTLSETTSSNLITIEFTNQNQNILAPVTSPTSSSLRSANTSSQQSVEPVSLRGDNSPANLRGDNNVDITNIQFQEVNSSRFDEIENHCLISNDWQLPEIIDPEDWEEYCDEEILETEVTSYLPPHPSFNFYDVTLD
ncbi:MAG: filamentous hemagglutinin N-terminal domain-containing protein [Jaaginema sp. PMC 1080.18]|nr:filamentous hemagglutinin N-terminal domain-containing protein [Jaaginema sp. PMC 1080.18]